MSNVYYEIKQLDCDHASTTFVKRFGSHRELNRYLAEIWEWAEGPTYYHQITMAQYIRRKGKSVSRDHALEAHENGHPHCVSHH